MSHDLVLKAKWWLSNSACYLLLTRLPLALLLCKNFSQANYMKLTTCRSWITFFFDKKFNLSAGQLGTIFLATSLIAALSMLPASSLAKRLGNIKVNTSYAYLTSFTDNLDNGSRPPSIRHLPCSNSSSEPAQTGNSSSHPSLLHSINGHCTSFSIPRECSTGI